MAASAKVRVEGPASGVSGTGGGAVWVQTELVGGDSGSGVVWVQTGLVGAGGGGG